MTQMRKPGEPFEDLLVDEDGSVKTKLLIFKSLKRTKSKKQKKELPEPKKALKTTSKK